MAKLFSEKLNNLEKSIESINEFKIKIDDLEQRLSSSETKLTQLINEIQPILSSHANALNEILAKIKST